jgi:hypothetical protein
MNGIWSENWVMLVPAIAENGQVVFFFLLEMGLYHDVLRERSV